MIINPYIFAGIAPPNPDPYWAQVTLLMHMNGNFFDQKGSAFTATGSPTFTAGKFSEALTVAGGPSGAVANLSNAGFAFSADFTVEFWALGTAGSTGAAILSHFTTSTAVGWQVYMNNNGTLSWYEYSGSGRYILTGTTDIRGGTFKHVAISRVSGTIRMFIDGVMQASAANTSAYDNSGLFLSIGYQAQGAARYPFSGKIDELRITKGVGRYVANFTPPDAPFAS